MNKYEVRMKANFIYIPKDRNSIKSEAKNSRTMIELIDAKSLLEASKIAKEMIDELERELPKILNWEAFEGTMKLDEVAVALLAIVAIVD